jgi:hypothetical protein
VARQYGITDRDGRQPPSMRELMSVEPVNYQGKGRTMTDDQLQQLLKDVRYLKDRQAILDVIMRHARGHDRHDTELMNSCFWDDGVDEHSQFVTPGPAYGDWANKVHTAGYFLHMHNITNHTCEIDGDTAHCETYVIGAMLPRSAPGRAKFVSGRYLDRLERRDGEWRILVRRTTIEVEAEGDAKWPENEISETFPRARGTPGTCRTHARCGLTHRLSSGTARPAEVEDTGPLEPGRDAEPPGDGRGLEPADLLHPPDVHLTYAARQVRIAVR